MSIIAISKRQSPCEQSLKLFNSIEIRHLEQRHLGNGAQVAIVSDAFCIAYHSHLTVYDHYYGDKDMTTNTSESGEETITIRMGISIDWLLSLPNLMDYLSFEEETTEQEARDYLQSLKNEGHDILPRPGSMPV